MSDVSRPCDTHPDLVNFSYPLPYLNAALRHQQKIRIVAIGSSSTAGVAPVLPYPPRLEMLLREKYDGRMIDVITAVRRRPTSCCAFSPTFSMRHLRS